MNGDSANSTREARLARRRERYRERREEETPEQREARLRRQRESAGGRRAQPGTEPRLEQLNSVKLGYAGVENLTEEGGHRQGAKKQVNSVKLGNGTERAGHIHYY